VLWPFRVDRDFDSNTGENPFFYNEGPIHGSYCAAVRISGRIEQDDAAEFSKFVAQFERRMSSEIVALANRFPRDMSEKCFYWENRAAGNKSEPTRIVLLDFEGGLLEEGLLLSEELAGWTTIVPRGAVCRSACAIAFFGGTYLRNSGLGAEDVYAGSRWLHVAGTLGFHAPQPVFENGQNVPTENLESTYITAFEQAEDYLRLLQHETDPSVVALVLSKTGRNDYHYVNAVSEAIRFNVDLFGYLRWDQARPIQIGQMCQNTWEWHEGPGTRPVGFDEVGQFLAPTSASIIAETGQDFLVDPPSDIFEDAWSFWSVGEALVLQFHDGDARFPEVISCRVTQVKFPWNQNIGQFKVEFSSEVFETTEASFIVPEWYMQNGNFPLTAMEFFYE